MQYLDSWPRVRQRQLRPQVECDRFCKVHLIVHSKSLHEGITLASIANSYVIFDEVIL